MGRGGKMIYRWKRNLDTLILSIIAILSVACTVNGRIMETSLTPVLSIMTPTPMRKPSDTIISTPSREMPPEVFETSRPILGTPTFEVPPTLDERAKDAFILELMRTNNDCLLPCWWGITPGETLWEEAFDFLYPFVLHIDNISDEDLESDIQVYSVPYTIPGILVINDVPGAIFSTYFVKQGVVDSIEVWAIGNKTDYTIPRILQTYGQPEEVLIDFVEPKWDSNNERLLYLNMIFDKSGIYLSYYALAHKSENILNICFDTEPWMLLWSIDPYQSEENPFGESALEGKLLLDQVTTMSNEAFYNYMITSSEPCIEFVLK